MNKKNSIKPIDHPVYGYWQALIHSFYSADLYVDVGKRWKGIGLLYLLLVMGLLTIPFATKITVLFTQTFEKDLIQPLRQLPLLYVQNGKISVDQPTPVFIKNEKNEDMIIIDTSGKINDFSNAYPKLSILITGNKIMYKAPTPDFLREGNTLVNKGTPISHALSSNTNGIFDGKKFVNEKRITLLRLFSQILIYPMLLALFYSTSVILFPVFAFLLQALTRMIFAFKMSFKQTCRLFIVSATPMLLLLFIFMYFNIAFTGTGFIMLFFAFGYYCFAVRSLKKESLTLAKN